MAREIYTDEMVEEEIHELQNSPHVKLAERERRVRNHRRQYLYYLRQMDKKGRELERQGITMESLARITDSEVYSEDEPC